jgi:O-antigen/teichoic acid export membrane protein
MTSDHARSSRLFRATAITSVLGYVNQAASVLVVPLYLAGLGPEKYGLMLTFLSLAGYFTLADGGLSWGAMILMGQSWGRGDKGEFARVFRHGVALALGSGLLAATAAAGVLLAGHWGWKLPFAVGAPEAVWLLALVGLQSAASPLVAMIYNAHFAAQDAHWPALLQGLSRLLGSLAGGVLAVVTHNPVLVLGCNVAANWGMTAVAALLLRRNHGWVFARGAVNDLAQYRAQIRTGGKNFLLQLARVVTGSAPVLTLSSLAGAQAVPLYTLSVTIVQFIIAPVTHWSGTAQTAYGEAWESGNRDWVVKTLAQTVRVALLVGGLTVGVASFCIPPAIAVLSHGALVVPPVMAVGVTLAGTCGMLVMQLQYALTGINRQRNAAFIEVGSAVGTSVCCYVGIRHFGAPAVGWAISAACALISLQFLPREVTKHFGLTTALIPASVWSRIVVAAGVAAVAVFWVRVPAEWSVPARVAMIAVVAMAGTALYAALCQVVGVFRWSELTGLWGRRTRNAGA